MLGISLFGVTPGYTKRDFSIESERLSPIIQACSELYLLDQFSVSVPPDGTLHVLGGRIVRNRAVSFIGRFRHAVELGGNRHGGHFGAGVWMVDEWLDGKDVASVINRMLALIQERMIDDAGRFIRTFDQVDWSDAQSLLTDLDGYRTGPPQGRHDSAPEHRSSKLLLTGDAQKEGDERPIVEIIRSLANQWDTLGNRVIYVSFDKAVVDAIRRLNRIEISTFEELKKQDAQRQTRRNGRPRWEEEEPSKTPPSTTHVDDNQDQLVNFTIPIRSDEGRTSLRSDKAEPQRSGAKALRNFLSLRVRSRAVNVSDAQSTRSSMALPRNITRRVLIGGAVLASVLLGVVLLGSAGDRLNAVTDALMLKVQLIAGLLRSKPPAPAPAEPQPHAAATPSDSGPSVAYTNVASVAEVRCIANVDGAGKALPDHLGSDEASFPRKLQTVEGHVKQLLQAGDKVGSLSRSDLETVGTLIAGERLFRECMDHIH